MIFFIFIFATFSFILSSFSGGGASIVLIPLLGMALVSSEVPAALAIGTFSSSFARVISFKSNIRWNIVARFLPGAIPGTFLGAFLLRYVDIDLINWITGIYLIVNLLFLFSARLPNREAQSSKIRLPTFIIGFFGGTLSSLVGAVGLALNNFYYSRGLVKEEIVATRAANEIVLHFIKLILYIHLGLFSAQSCKLGLAVAVGAIVSSLILKKVMVGMSCVSFNRISNGAITFASVFVFFQSTQTILKNKQPSLWVTSSPEEIALKINWAGSNIEIELEKYGGFVLEREIPFHQLSSTTQLKILSLVSHSQVRKVEELIRRSGTTYEIAFKDGEKLRAIEVPRSTLF